MHPAEEEVGGGAGGEEQVVAERGSSRSVGQGRSDSGPVLAPLIFLSLFSRNASEGEA